MNGKSARMNSGLVRAGRCAVQAISSRGSSGSRQANTMAGRLMDTAR
jgi:hypothetical protein